MLFFKALLSLPGSLAFGITWASDPGGCWRFPRNRRFGTFFRVFVDIDIFDNWYNWPPKVESHSNLMHLAAVHQAAGCITCSIPSGQGGWFSFDPSGLICETIIESRMVLEKTTCCRLRSCCARQWRGCCGFVDWGTPEWHLRFNSDIFPMKMIQPDQIAITINDWGYSIFGPTLFGNLQNCSWLQLKFETLQSCESWGRAEHMCVYIYMYITYIYILHISYIYITYIVYIYTYISHDLIYIK